jgi:hypothetical protein
LICSDFDGASIELIHCSVGSRYTFSEPHLRSSVLEALDHGWKWVGRMAHRYIVQDAIFSFSTGEGWAATFQMIGVGQPGKKRTNFDSVTLSWIEVF